MKSVSNFLVSFSWLCIIIFTVGTAFAAVPVAEDDGYSVTEGGTLTIDAVSGVLSNDTDDDGDDLDADLVDDVSNGTLSLNTADGSFTYTHDGSETTSDSFTYYANDGTENSNLATVTITVSAENDVPVAENDSYSVAEGGTLNVNPASSVLINDTDADGDSLTVGMPRPETDVSNGTLTLRANGSFTYTHDGSETTSDIFTYVANDGTSDSNVATVSITVTSENDVPIANPDSYTVAEGGTLNIAAAGVLINDTDADLDPLTVGDPRSNSPTTNGTLTLNVDGSFTYTHDGSETTSDSFTYAANDGTSDSNVATVSITVTSENDVPIANPDSYTVAEGGTLNIAAAGVLINDTDADLDPLTVGDPRSNSPTTNGTLTLNVDGSFTYTHDGSETTSDSFTYAANDGTSDSDVATVSITVTSENDVPIANPDSYTVAEGGTLNIAAAGVLINDTDADLDPLTVGDPRSNSPTTNGTLTLNVDGSFTYTHDGSETTSDSFTYVANDGTSDSDVATVSITVTSQNDRPVIIGQVGSPSTDEDIPLDLFNFSPYLAVTDADNMYPDGFSLVIQNGDKYTHSGTEIRPISNYFGDLTVNVAVDDGSGAPNSQSDTFGLSVTVNPLDDPPNVDNIPNQTIAEGALQFPLLNLATYLTEVDGDEVIWSSSGSIELAVSIVNGLVTVSVPDEDWNGAETITFTATDVTTAGLSASDNVFFRVNAVNDAPQITSEAWTAANTGVEYRYTATATDVDSDDDSLVWSFGGTEPDGMELAPGTGSSTTITWTPPSGVDSSGDITLQVSDGDKTTTQEFTIAVTDMPAVIIDSVNQDTTSTATVNATVVAPGIPAATEHGICWGDTEDLTVNDTCTTDGPVSAAGPYTTPLTDLVLGDTYYVRAYAVNDTGDGPQPVYSEAVEFQLNFPPRATLSGAPASLTNATTSSLQVGGIGVVSYMYRLDGGSWSGEQLVSQKIVENALGEGMHRIEVVGKAESVTTGGIWQAEKDATEIAWVVDLTPPSAEIANYPTGTIGPYGNDILVQGEEVVAYRYSLDEGATWSSVYPASVPIILPDLDDGRNTLSVVGADRAGNWQDDDDARKIEWLVDASVPTALLTNLPDAVTGETYISIGVATPQGGEPVKEYYYRFDDSDDWIYGTVSQTIDQSWPLGREGEHTLCVNAGNGAGLWQDGTDGQSSIDSATCYTWRIDLTPASVTGFTVEDTEKYIKQEQILPASKSVKALLDVDIYRCSRGNRSLSRLVFPVRDHTGYPGQCRGIFLQCYSRNRRICGKDDCRRVGPE
jgi:VCBS repeat-containing protein